MNHYDILDQIGRGTYGTVYKGIERESGRTYVLKEIDIKNLPNEVIDNIATEINVLAKLKHDFIVKYKEYFRVGRFIYIVMEYCDGGDMYSRIVRNRNQPFPTDLVFKWLIQCCLVLLYMHDKNVIHRDIKPQNIFLDHDDNVRVGDFGVCRVLHSSHDMAQTAIGTPLYIAPEILKGNAYDAKVDVWSLGCTFYELLTSKPPYSQFTIYSILNNGGIGKDKKINCSCDEHLKSIIESMLRVHPE